MIAPARPAMLLDPEWISLLIPLHAGANKTNNFFRRIGTLDLLGGS
jgi:hypothetical protein